MRENRLKRLLADRRTAVNAWLSIPSSYSAEGVARQGFDSVTVDLQHGMIGPETAVAMLQAISTTDAVPLVRVPRNDGAQIMWLLDAGAYGVICPMVSTADEARAFARACRYPDRGTRSFGPARGLLYGGADYVAEANGQILAIPMVETRRAVDDIDAILAVEDVDMLYIGPNDLAFAYGETPGSERAAPRTAEAIDHVLERTHAAGKTVGIFCPSAESAGRRRDQGFDLVTPGNDFGTLTRALRSAVATVRGEDDVAPKGGGY